MTMRPARVTFDLFVVKKPVLIGCGHLARTFGACRQHQESPTIYGSVVQQQFCHRSGTHIVNFTPKPTKATFMRASKANPGTSENGESL